MTTTTPFLIRDIGSLWAAALPFSESRDPTQQQQQQQKDLDGAVVVRCHMITSTAGVSASASSSSALVGKKMAGHIRSRDQLNTNNNSNDKELTVETATIPLQDSILELVPPILLCRQKQQQQQQQPLSQSSRIFSRLLSEKLETSNSHDGAFSSFSSSFSSCSWSRAVLAATLSGKNVLIGGCPAASEHCSRSQSLSGLLSELQAYQDELDEILCSFVLLHVVHQPMLFVAPTTTSSSSPSAAVSVADSFTAAAPNCVPGPIALIITTDSDRSARLTSLLQNQLLSVCNADSDLNDLSNNTSHSAEQQQQEQQRKRVVHSAEIAIGTPAALAERFRAGATSASPLADRFAFSTKRISLVVVDGVDQLERCLYPNPVEMLTSLLLPCCRSSGASDMAAQFVATMRGGGAQSNNTSSSSSSALAYACSQKAKATTISSSPPLFSCLLGKGGVGHLLVLEQDGQPAIGAAAAKTTEPPLSFKQRAETLRQDEQRQDEATAIVENNNNKSNNAVMMMTSHWDAHGVLFDPAATVVVWHLQHVEQWRDNVERLMRHELNSNGSNNGQEDHEEDDDDDDEQFIANATPFTIRDAVCGGHAATHSQAVGLVLEVTHPLLRDKLVQILQSIKTSASPVSSSTHHFFKSQLSFVTFLLPRIAYEPVFFRRWRAACGDDDDDDDDDDEFAIESSKRKTSHSHSSVAASSWLELETPDSILPRTIIFRNVCRSVFAVWPPSSLSRARLEAEFLGDCFARCSGTCSVGTEIGGGGGNNNTISRSSSNLRATWWVHSTDSHSGADKDVIEKCGDNDTEQQYRFHDEVRLAVTFGNFAGMAHALNRGGKEGSVGGGSTNFLSRKFRRSNGKERYILGHVAVVENMLLQMEEMIAPNSKFDPNVDATMLALETDEL